MSYTAERLEKLLAALMNQCIWGALHSSVAQFIEEHLNHHPHDLDHCRWALSITASAHWDSALLTLTRLFSRDKQSLSIQKLLRVAEGNWNLFQHVEPNRVLGQVQRDQALLEELQPLLQELKDLRDTRVAHLDSSTLKQGSRRIEGKDLHPMQRSSQIRLQKAAQEILGAYYELYHACDFDFALGEHCYEWLLSVLVERGRQHNEQRDHLLEELEKDG